MALSWRRLMGAWALASVGLVLHGCAQPARIPIEVLKGPVNTGNAGQLAALACRNEDKIVHIDIQLNWPYDKLEEEQTSFERLVFWDDENEYLFPKGTFFFLHGEYVVRGYFIARSGGVHQGIQSNAFEKVDDAAVLLNPYVVEQPLKPGKC
ncbi:MAG TPA: hypothetical protein VGJ75_07280 [Dongiaceae bacterium]|jgi:hypothetical protein